MPPIIFCQSRNRFYLCEVIPIIYEDTERRFQVKGFSDACGRRQFHEDSRRTRNHTTGSQPTHFRTGADIRNPAVQPRTRSRVADKGGAGVPGICSQNRGCLHGCGGFRRRKRKKFRESGAYCCGNGTLVASYTEKDELRICRRHRTTADVISGGAVTESLLSPLIWYELSNP